jgi:hypothetical protein
MQYAFSAWSDLACFILKEIRDLNEGLIVSHLILFPLLDQAFWKPFFARFKVR